MAMIDDLRQERIRRGLSQAAVSHAMGTTQSAVSRAEHGGNPTQDFLQRYQKALDTYPSSSTLDIETIRLLVKDIARRNDVAELYAPGQIPTSTCYTARTPVLNTAYSKPRTLRTNWNRHLAGPCRCSPSTHWNTRPLTAEPASDSWNTSAPIWCV